MEIVRDAAPEKPRIPTVDMFDGIDGAKTYINESLLRYFEPDEAADWWYSVRSDLKGLTPWELWNTDPNAVIRAFHTTLGKIGG